MEIVEKAIKNMLPFFNCTLMTIPGVDVTTAANMLAEIGDISRFPDANKLAKFAGICPINFSSAGKGKDMCPKQAITGDFLLSGNQDDSDFHKWNARRLVNTMYGMLKNHTEYREPEE